MFKPYPRLEKLQKNIDNFITEEDENFPELSVSKGYWEVKHRPIGWDKADAQYLPTSATVAHSPMTLALGVVQRQLMSIIEICAKLTLTLIDNNWHQLTLDLPPCTCLKLKAVFTSLNPPSDIHPDSSIPPSNIHPDPLSWHSPWPSIPAENED